MIKAYSYLRFSHPSQVRTDKLWKQLESARKYAEDNELELDETLSFQDLGISAFEGANRDVGKLGEFHLAIKHGVVEKGSYLLVESLDRLSRQTARKALRTLEDICDEGITVVTLIDRQIYTAERLDRDPTALLISLVIFLRANDESETKRQRQINAWHSKIERAQKGDRKLISGVLPSWLKREGDKIVVDQALAMPIKLIFKLAELGQATTTIARTLNKNNIPTMRGGKFWRGSTVGYFLTLDTVTGTYTPYKYKQPTDPEKIGKYKPIKNFYPRIVSQKTWNTVQAFIKERQKHRNFATVTSSQPKKNVLATLAKCPACGNGMSRRQFKPEPHLYGITEWHLVCSGAIMGTDCNMETVLYRAIHEGIFAECMEVFEGYLKDWEKSSRRSKKQNIRIVTARVQELGTLLQDDPENIDKINLQLKGLFTKVDVHIEDNSLCFHWRAGGTSKLDYFKQLVSATDDVRDAFQQSIIQR